MASGTVDIDFGAFPGNKVASSVITGQGGFSSTTSLVEAWQLPRADTTDHTVMEQVQDYVIVQVSEFVNGTGFTIYAISPDVNNRYGKYTIAWVWQ